VAPSWLGRFFVPKGRKIEFRVNGEKYGVEAYSQGRYFTVTAEHWNNPPLVLRPIQAAVEKALAIAEDLQQRFPLSSATGNSGAGSASRSTSDSSGSTGADNTSADSTNSSSSSSDFIAPGQRHDAIT
jgi:hypothetical protein